MTKKRNISVEKKIFFIIFGILVTFVLIILGVGANFYTNLSHSINRTYESVERSNVQRKTPISGDNRSPFSVLLMGIDTGDLGRAEQGRSDTLMVAAVNPIDKQTTIVSIPRDTYVEIKGRKTMDKINHAYAFGGTAMAIDTVQNYLDIPIDHYVSINMKGLKELVDAIGGIEVNNRFTFSQDNYYFSIGKISLNGDQALAYSRMRYEDPNGDYGRQERQRKIIEGIVKKIVSFSGISKYKMVLESLETNMKTDMNFDEMQKVFLEYRNAFGKVQFDQLKGEGFMLEKISYQKVTVPELKRIQQKLKDQLKLNYK
ncbi:transcriptional attenuator, LytR family [Enterococcus faecalis]|uniref:LCP family glycopolymer transferase n=1 Tax=Enterococcus faecalis TaxID=1351 RepID=UPI00088E0B47|nr:LCP family protein [Enterococcus faecalis]EGO7767559.1 transcriptional regulator [Enterococcus faecalis]MBJ1687898.1 LCP family protein [Enterococcus faecalis]SDN89513.1 transcriptional attenuator, LytR family [Enterococcus faecalis]HBI1674830.1 LCP family protein [Enterococcus faecalis]HBI1677536.1 LCP family protein [Enterococcus faecalis]